MADITRAAPFVRHLRASPTTYVRHLRKGRVAHQGTGISFWFRPLTAVLSEVPVDDRELPLLFHARTRDHQDAAVQATVTFRVADPALAATRLDFSIDPGSGRWRGTPLEQLGSLLTESAQEQALDLLARTPLAEALIDAVPVLRERVMTGLTADPRLAEIGVTVLGARVVAVRPEPELERALRTPAREQVQQEADRATFERRAHAVERERAIAENELQTRIELASREQQLVAENGRNARLQAEESAAAARIETDAQADRETRLAESRAQATRMVGEAEAHAEAARLAAYRDLEAGVLLGLAAKELAGSLPAIGQLVVTPELLTSTLARLAGRDGTGGGADAEPRA